MTRAHTRGLVRCAVLLLALYLAVDVATPLLPGAFRFDPRQSVDAAGRVGLPVVTPAPAARSERLLVAPADGPRRPNLRSISQAVPVFAHVVHPPDAGSSSSPSEDD